MSDQKPTNHAKDFVDGTAELGLNGTANVVSGPVDLVSGAAYSAFNGLSALGNEALALGNLILGDSAGASRRHNLAGKDIENAGDHLLNAAEGVYDTGKGAVQIAGALAGSVPATATAIADNMVNDGTQYTAPSLAGDTKKPATDLAGKDDDIAHDAARAVGQGVFKLAAAPFYAVANVGSAAGNAALSAVGNDEIGHTGRDRSEAALEQLKDAGTNTLDAAKSGAGVVVGAGGLAASAIGIAPSAAMLVKEELVDGKTHPLRENTNTIAHEEPAVNKPTPIVDKTPLEFKLDIQAADTIHASTEEIFKKLEASLHPIKEKLGNTDFKASHDTHDDGAKLTTPVDKSTAIKQQR